MSTFARVDVGKSQLCLQSHGASQVLAGGTEICSGSDSSTHENEIAEQKETEEASVRETNEATKGTDTAPELVTTETKKENGSDDGKQTDETSEAN